MKTALIISCFSWYDNRLKPIKELLQSKYKYKVYCFTSDFIHTTKNYIEEKNPELEYIHVPSYKKNLSIKRFISYICFGNRINKKIKELSPELIYLVLPPNNTARYCLRYKKRHPFVLYYIDLIDLWPESMPINNKLKNNLLMKKWALLRNSSFIYADHIFVECNYYRERLQGIIDEKKSSVLYLTREMTNAEKELVESNLKKKQHSDSLVSLCYLGSINHIIDIERVCSLIQEIKKTRFDVELKIIGDGESRKELIKRAEDAGAKVTYHGKIYDQIQKIELLSTCDYGLNIYEDGAAVGLTIKSIDYFSMGIPIINTIKGDTWEMVSQYKVGINYGSSVNDCVEKILNMNRELGENAYDLYKKKFSHDAFNETVINSFTRK